MSAAREGALGVLQEKGDLLVVTDTPGADVERLGIGADGEQLEADSTTALGMKWAVGAQGAGTTYPYGGDIKSAGNYYHAHGDFTAGEAAAIDEESVIVMSFAGKLAAFSWIGDAADATTIIRIVINGLVVDTVTLTGASGSVALNGTVFAAGDEMAIQYGDGVVGPTSGTKPGKGTASLGVVRA